MTEVLFPPSEKCSDVLDAGKYVLPCSFTDEVDDGHDLIATNDRVAHLEEVAVLEDLLFGLLNCLH